MRELYVLSSIYNPTSAETNHIMAYVKGFAENGFNITLFFLRPSSNYDKCHEIIDNVKFVYLWDNLNLVNKFKARLLPLKRFYSIMNAGTPVFVTGCADEISILRHKRNIRLFHERTENPYRVKNRLFYLYKKSLPELDGLIVITPSLRDFYIEEFGIKPEKVLVANMVVDESRFSSLRVNNNSHTIGYCGTISEWKDGVSYLIKAFGIVHQKHPEYKLVLMGRFENNETEKRLLSIVNSLGLNDSVVFTGIIENADMPRRLKEAEILALSRPRQKERAFGFATKIGEYLMTGRPVVMTDVGDVSYYLKDKESVVLAQPNNENDFAVKLIWVIEHPNEAIIIGKRGKEVATKEFNYLKESKKILDFIFQ